MVTAVKTLGNTIGVTIPPGETFSGYSCATDAAEPLVVWVPADPANTQYADLLRLQAEGLLEIKEYSPPPPTIASLFGDVGVCISALEAVRFQVDSGHPSREAIAQIADLLLRRPADSFPADLGRFLKDRAATATG